MMISQMEEILVLNLKILNREGFWGCFDKIIKFIMKGDDKFGSLATTNWQRDCSHAIIQLWFIEIPITNAAPQAE
jgi:hypothetical protein